MYLIRNGATKDEIRERIGKVYDLSLNVDEIRRVNHYNETCQITVPQAIRCFIDSTSFEDAIRNAISIDGDSDTIAAMTGPLAEAFYGVPEDLKKRAESFLPADMRDVLTKFYNRYGI